jgi:hypothetical protein
VRWSKHRPALCTTDRARGGRGPRAPRHNRVACAGPRPTRMTGGCDGWAYAEGTPQAATIRPDRPGSSGSFCCVGTVHGKLKQRCGGSSHTSEALGRMPSWRLCDSTLVREGVLGLRAEAIGRQRGCDANLLLFASQVHSHDLHAFIYVTGPRHPLVWLLKPPLSPTGAGTGRGSPRGALTRLSWTRPRTLEQACRITEQQGM